MGEIIPSESLSHVAYTGIHSMHSQKIKQPYGVLERIEPERRKVRKKTYKKCPRRKIRKMSPQNSWNQADSLKKKRHKNKPEMQKETSTWKQPCKLLRTEPLNTARPKNTHVPKNLRSEWIRGLQTSQKTTPHCSRKELGESWPRKRARKGRTEKRERSPTHPKQNRTEQHQASTEGIVATEKKRDERKRSNAKDPYNSAKKNTVTKDKQLGGRPQQCPWKNCS